MLPMPPQDSPPLKAILSAPEHGSNQPRPDKGLQDCKDTILTC